MTELDKSHILHSVDDSQIDLSSFSLMDRLRIISNEKPDQYSEEVVERVTQLVQYETDYPENKKRYSLLQTRDDFQLYVRLHPEWQGKSVGEVKKDFETGGSAFYTAWNKWLRRSEMSSAERRIATESLFPYQKNDWTGFSTFSDWQNELIRHPEWQGKSKVEMANDRTSGGYEFQRAFGKWARKKVKDRRERKKLFDSLFVKRKRETRWSSFETIEQWQEEYSHHPEWQGKGIKDIARDTETGGSSFHAGFMKWVRRTASEREERTRLVDKVFTRAVKDWTSLTTLDQWLDEFKLHPEWEGETVSAVSKGSKDGAVFYNRFMLWVNRTAKSATEKEEYISAVFLNRRKRSLEEIIQISPDEAEEDILKLL